MKTKSTCEKLGKFAFSYWSVFCENTGLHGWKYVVSGTSTFSRFGWFVTCSTAMAISVALITLSWISFRDDAMLTLPFKTQLKNAGNFFPAVTICSFNKISKRAAFDMAQKLQISNSTSVDKIAQSLKLLGLLVSNKYHIIPEEEYNFLTNILTQNGLDEQKVFEQIAPSLDKLFKRCRWKGKDIRCNIMFQTINSPAGVCWSSNYYGLKTIVFRYNAHINFLKNSGGAYETGLEVLLDNDPSDYFTSDIPSIGFQVQVHNPFDFPHFALPSVLNEINTNNFISVSTESTSSTDAVKSLSDSERSCVFPYDRVMDVLTRYTYQNCVTECKVSIIMEICGCVPFYLKSNTSIFRKACTIKDQSCIARNQDKVYDIFRKRPHAGESILKCNCFPNCVYITFLPYISKGPLDSDHFTSFRFIEFGINLENLTAIRVFSRALTKSVFRRDLRFSWVSLLGFYGGIAGLLTAFSFITIVECIYLLGIRRNKEAVLWDESALWRIDVAPLQKDNEGIYSKAIWNWSCKLVQKVEHLK